MKEFSEREEAHAKTRVQIKQQKRVTRKGGFELNKQRFFEQISKDKLPVVPQEAVAEV